MLCLAALAAPRVSGQDSHPGDREPRPAEHQPALGVPAAFGPLAQPQEVALEAGTPLHQSPAPRAPVLDVLDVAVAAPVLERRGAWVRTRSADLAGWVLLAGEDEIGAQITPLSGLPDGLRPPALDPARLMVARNHLNAHTATTVDGYLLLSDVALATVRRRLAIILGSIDRDVAQRYGLPLVRAQDEAVVVFARTAAFRAFVRQDDAEHGASFHLGNARGSLAALTAEGLGVGQLETLLVHEVSHLAIRRMLGVGLMPWIEEGMAEDLAYFRRDRNGRPIAGTLRQVTQTRVEEHSDAQGRRSFIERRLGGIDALEDLNRGLGLGQQVGLEALVRMDAAHFYGGSDRLRYPRAAFFVRFLEQAQAAGFGRYLLAISRGGRVDAQTLLSYLDTDWPALERGFVHWLHRLWADTMVAR